jgi:hypothetical protein
MLPVATAALFVTLLAPAGISAEQTVDRTWLDETTWPLFVADRKLDVNDQDDPHTKLLKQRYNAAQSELRGRYIFWLQSVGTVDKVFETAARVIAARLEVESPAADRLALLKEKVEFARVVEKQADVSRKNLRGAQRDIDLMCATYFRLDAEVELLRAQRAAKQPSEK